MQDLVAEHSAFNGGIKGTMELVRSDSPSVVNGIASTGAWASRNWNTWGFACAASVLSLFIALAVYFSISAHAAVSIGLPAFLALNGYVLWRAHSSRRRWVAVGSDDQLYVRLFARLYGNQGDVHEPDVLVLGAPEIASMSIRTVQVFLYGPKPRIVEWLVVEPAELVAEDVYRHVRPILAAADPDKVALVNYEDGRFTIQWKWWQPSLREFLQRLRQECPSFTIGLEDSSELDLNSIWRGISLNLDPKRRQLLVRAMQLGFGCECKRLLSRYKYISYQKAATYLAEIYQEEVETEPPCCSA